MIYLLLFITFLKIGAFTFGGGYAMIPLIQNEVIANGWLEKQALIDFIAISESTPGPFAINIATYIGSELGGILGATCATIGVILPSLIIILIVAKFFAKFKEYKIVKGCMVGLKASVIGLIASSVISMGITVFVPNGIENFAINKDLYISIIIFIIALICTLKKAHPIIVICISAILGIISGIILKIL